MNRPLIQQPIAIVGAACRLPGADNVDQFWRLLVEGKDAIHEFPPDRLDRDLYFSTQKGVRGKTYSSIGGLIPSRPLDHLLVPLAKTSYQDFDESHWIMAEVAACAWKNASRRTGLQMHNAPNRSDSHQENASGRVGVYIGHSGGSRRAGEVIYSSLAGQTAELIDRLPQLQSMNPNERERIKSELCSRMRHNKANRTAEGKPFLDASSAARLVALNLQLDGPQMVIDAACASSLASLAMACLSLQSGDIDAAIVGGASYNKIDSLILFSQAQSCSASGSRPFDENADGLISSEGYIALVLKTLDQAVLNNDLIWGVIRGVGMSTDGRGKSLWAPRREGQLKAVQRAYSNDIDPKRVQYVEAHATSTKVGDATEVQALGDFFLPILGSRKIPIGSVKSNIGHTLETAGLAGVLKTVLAMHHATIPPSIHFQTPSQSIPWENIPFQIPTSPRVWDLPSDGLPRCGAVNAFGIGGLNVHVVVEQGVNHGVPSHASKPFPKRAINTTGSTLPQKQQIAIIGRGIIVPGANGFPALVELTKTNRTQLIPPPSDRWKSLVGLKGAAATIATARGGYLTDYAYDWMKHRVPPKQVQNANPLQFMLLDAAGQALEEARLAGTNVDFERTAVVVGTIFGGEFGHQLQLGLRLMELRRDIHQTLIDAGISQSEIIPILDAFEKSFLERNPALLDETGSFTSSTLASRITKQYNLQGGALAIDTGACSSLSALYAAMNLLESGYSDSVICAAGNRAMDLPSFETLAAKGLLENELSAYLPGEGVAVLLLKKLSDAHRDQNKIFGILNPMRIEKERRQAFLQSHPKPSSIQPLIGDLQAARGLTEIIHHLASPSSQSRTSVEQMTDDYLLHSICVSSSVDGSIPKIHEDSLAPPMESMIDQPIRMPAMTTHHHLASDRAIVAMFPGQGSQQRGSIELCLDASENARSILRKAEAVLRSMGSAGFDEIARKAADGARDSSWYSQATILISDVVHWYAIRDHGFEPSSVVGHSLGEWAALVAAESWDLESALRFLKIRANAVDDLAMQDRGLLSIPLDYERVTGRLCEFANSLVVTHRNSPTQTVVGGPIQQLEELDARLQKFSVQSVLLNVPAPFHTPEMAGAAHRLALGASTLQLLPPKRIFFSTVSNSYESDPRRIVRNLIHQLTTPVDFCSAIETLYEHGGRRFGEIGPGKVLTRLCNNILESRSFECFEFRDGLSHTKWNELPNQSLATKQPSHPQASHSVRQTSEMEVVDATRVRRQRRKDQATMANHKNTAISEESDTSFVEPSRANQSIRPSVAPQSSRVDGKTPALETFIKDFIVEHTGYPKEMIQLDWELEADLGIDSIKLVQLMGELRELFDLDPQVVRNAGVRTLREILTLLESSGGKREWLEEPATAPPVSLPTIPTLEQSPTIVETSASVPRAQLETFMVDFVIEHTGYPRHMVDMNAELEADLGLDSIKLAQLMGELRSHFGFDLNSDVRKRLAKAKTLSEILSTLGVAEPQSTEGPDTTSQRNLSSPVISAKVPLETGKFAEMHELYAPRIHLQLINDLKHWSEGSSLDRNRMSFGCATKLQDFANAVQVPKENLQGLLNRHGHQAEWRDLATFLEASPAENEKGNRETEVIERSQPLVTNRYLLRAQSSSNQPRSSHVEWQGAACVLGSNAVATELGNRLRAQGVPTLMIDSDTSESVAIARLDAFWKTHKIVPYLFLTSPHDAQAIGSIGEHDRLNERHATIRSLFWICQSWFIRHVQSGSVDHASLIALTKLGGDFGFREGGIAPESGALGGLLKAILIESWVNGHRQLPIKVIDSGANASPSDIVEQAWIELANPSFDTEVGWIHGTRQVVRAIPSPTTTKNFRPSPGVWICTGGGRGITAFVAEQLAKRYGLELHLLGMAPAPNIPPQFRDLDEQGRKEFKNRVMLEATADGLNSVKAWQDMEKQLEIDATLRRMRNNGLSVYYHGCDVTDRKSLDLCIAHIREHYGPIRGCLHGAGVGQDSRFERKRPDKVRQCLGAKMDGLVNLMQSTLQDPLECFIGFGSISGRFGANGHTDYSSANEALAKYMGWYRSQRPEVRSTAFHWHAWGDVGMATKPETKLALEMIEMQFMPAEEGLLHLTNEIEAGLPEAEVLITDDRYFRMFYPSETIQTSSNDARSRSQTLIRPLHDRIEDCNGGLRYHGKLDPTRDVFLKEHVYEGNPLLPFVIAMECMAEAATASQALREPEYFPMRFDNLTIHRPFRLESQAPREYFVECSRDGDSNSATSKLRFCAPFLNRSGMIVDAAREYSSTEWRRSDATSLLNWDKPTISIASSSTPAYPKPSQPFFVGPAFKVLKQYSLGGNRITGRILAPSLIELVGSHRSTEGWVLPCAVIDACLFTSGILAWNAVRPGICLPMSIQSMQVLDRPRAGESCTVESRLIRSDDRFVWFDFCVWGSDSRLLIASKNYQAAWVGNVS